MTVVETQKMSLANTHTKENELKSTKKPPETEKQLAPQSEPKAHAKKKRKATKDPNDPILSTKDYEHIATSVKETMEESVTAIVTSQQAMQMVLDNKMAELKILI